MNFLAVLKSERSCIDVERGPRTVMVGAGNSEGCGNNFGGGLAKLFGLAWQNIWRWGGKKNRRWGGNFLGWGSKGFFEEKHGKFFGGRWQKFGGWMTKKNWGWGGKNLFSHPIPKIFCHSTPQKFWPPNTPKNFGHSYPKIFCHAISQKKLPPPPQKKCSSLSIFIFQISVKIKKFQCKVLILRCTSSRQCDVEPQIRTTSQTFSRTWNWFGWITMNPFNLLSTIT